MLKRDRDSYYLLNSNDFIINFIILLEQVQANETDFEFTLNQLRYINSQK